MSDVTIRVNSGAAASIEKRIEQIIGDFSDTVVEMARDIVPVDTGNLKRSIEAKRDGKFRYLVQTRTGYGAYVELGTRKMAAQPYLSPAIRQALATFKGSK